MIRLKIYTNASTFLHSSLALCTYSIFAKRFTSTCITANATIGVIEEQIDQFAIARCLYADIPIAGGIRILLCRGDDIRLSIIVVFRASSVIKCVDKRLVGFIFVQTTQCLGCLVFCICTICSHSIDDDSVPDLLAQQSRRLSFSSGGSACASLIVSIFSQTGGNPSTPLHNAQYVSTIKPCFSFCGCAIGACVPVRSASSFDALPSSVFLSRIYE